MTRPRLADLLALPPTVDVREAAAVLGVSRDALYDALTAGTAPVRTVRVGRVIRVPVPALLDVLGATPELLDALHRVANGTATARAGPEGPAAATDPATPPRDTRCPVP